MATDGGKVGAVFEKVLKLLYKVISQGFWTGMGFVTGITAFDHGLRVGRKRVEGMYVLIIRYVTYV